MPGLVWRRAPLLALLLLAARGGQSAPQGAHDADSFALDLGWSATVRAGDAKTAAAALDAEFIWTDRSGRNRNKTQTLANLRALAAALTEESPAGADPDRPAKSSREFYSYDRLEVVTGSRPDSRFMRIWARRPQGWRLFLMIDTPIETGAAAPFSIPGGGRAPGCDNPCRNIPFSPKTPAQREILETFKRLKTDEWHPDPADWAPYVLDGVNYVTSAGVLSKADRVNRLEQQNKSGAASLPGDPVLSLRIVEFGRSAVMLARHAPFLGGKPYYSVRVWAFRDGKWRFANSQQTTIAAAAPLPPVK